MTGDFYNAYGNCGAITQELLIHLERVRESQPFYEEKKDTSQNRNIASDVGLKSRIRAGAFRR
jgi:hypothetical protein